jgi:dUTP pyrophosphatase
MTTLQRAGLSGSLVLFGALANGHVPDALAIVAIVMGILLFPQLTSRPRVRVKRLSPLASIPRYAKPGDSGADLRSTVNMVIPAHGRGLVDTDLAFEIPDGFEMQVRPRSGMSLKDGSVAILGTIDRGYRAGVGVILYNHTSEPYPVNIGQRVAQAVIAPVAHARFVEADELSQTERGAGGFGHTGA